MGVLYHVSMGDAHKSLFVYTDAVRLVYNRLVSAPDLRREPELIALAVNLTQNAKCAAALCEGGNFEKLVRRAVACKDDLLFKVLRNCSQARTHATSLRCIDTMAGYEHTHQCSHVACSP